MRVSAPCERNVMLQDAGLSSAAGQPQQSDLPSDTILSPFLIGLIARHLHLWDVLTCRLVSSCWKASFSSFIPSLAIAFPQALLTLPYSSDDEGSCLPAPRGLPPTGLQQAWSYLTLFVDDSRMGLLQQGSDPWALLRDRMAQCSQHTQRLRLRLHASLVFQFTAMPVVCTSLWGEQAAEGWAEPLRSLKALELAVTLGRDIKAPVLHSLLAPCTGLTSLSLKLFALDSEHWEAVLLPSRLTSLTLQCTSRQWPQGQLQQANQDPASSGVLSSGASGTQVAVPSSQPASNLAGLEFLALSSPALSQGLPSWVAAATGLRCLLLHGGRVPYTLGTAASGLGFLKHLTQLHTLSFAAPLLCPEEWGCLLTLSHLTELRINDWTGPVAQPSHLLVPGSGSDYPNQGFNLRPLQLLGPPAWLQQGLNTVTLAALPAADPAAADLDPVPQLQAAEADLDEQLPVAHLGGVMGFGALSRLHTLRVCLASPLQLAYLVSLPPGAGLPSSLRSLQVAFTDAPRKAEAAGVTGSGVEQGGRAEGAAVSGPSGTPELDPALRQRLEGGLDVSGPQQLQAALKPEPEAPGSGQCLWPGLARCCPGLLSLNVRRTWSLTLDREAVRQLAQGMPRLEELQFCGGLQLPGDALQPLSHLQWLQVLSLGAITGPPLELGTSSIPTTLRSLSLLNVDIVDDAPGGRSASGLPSSLLALQLKRCRWHSAGPSSSMRQEPGRQSDDRLLLAAVAGCYALRELRLSFEAEGGEPPQQPAACHFSLLQPLRQLYLLDLNLAQMQQGYPYAAMVGQLAALTSLHRLHLSVLPQARGWDAEPEEEACGPWRQKWEHQQRQQGAAPCAPSVPEALCSLSKLRNLHTLELEVLRTETAGMLDKHFATTLPNCRVTLVVDNFVQMMEDFDERLSRLDEGDLGSEEDEDQEMQEELEEELAALDAEN